MFWRGGAGGNIPMYCWPYGCPTEPDLEPIAPICWEEGFTDEDINEFVLDEMSIVLGLLSCCEGDGLYGVWTAPPMRNCDVRLWYMSGVGAV